MKNPKINEQAIKAFYDHYKNDSVEEFRAFCIQLIMNARAPNQQILRQINTMSKDQILKSVNNFAFKGQGLGVIK